MENPIGFSIAFVKIAAASGTTTTDNIYRVMIYHDKQTNGGAATAALLLAEDDMLAFRQLQQSGRFRILFDKTRPITTTGMGSATTAGETQHFVDVDVPLNVPLEFDASTGAITDLTTNNIGLVVWNQETATITYQARVRVRFSDN